jgi:hypothetical protein
MLVEWFAFAFVAVIVLWSINWAMRRDEGRGPGEPDEILCRPDPVSAGPGVVTSPGRGRGEAGGPDRTPRGPRGLRRDRSQNYKDATRPRW